MFKCFNRKDEVRYLSVVYSDKFGDDGIMEISNIIDVDTFEKINDQYYKDKNNYYFYKKMSDGGTLQLVENYKDKN